MMVNFEWGGTEGHAFLVSRGLRVISAFFVSSRSDALWSPSVIPFDSMSSPSPGERKVGQKVVNPHPQSKSKSGGKKPKRKEMSAKDSKSNADEREKDTEKEQLSKKAKKVSFAELGVNEVLTETAKLMGWSSPTPIQRDSIPYALEGRYLPFHDPRSSFPHS